MGRVLCISSQTVYGPVGNAAAGPALQALGHEVLALPTVVLSNHPGHGKPAGQSTPAPIMADMLQRLSSLGAFDSLDAVMTGYFTSAEQVIVVADHIVSLAKRMEHLHVLVDPVIGDHGALYVAEDVAVSIRDRLLPLATITTPNWFELQWLTGLSDIDEAIHRLNVAETIVTSIPKGEQLVTRLEAAGTGAVHFASKLAHVPHGTGDYLAGCYLAERLSAAPALAFERAMTRLESAIQRSEGSAVLTVA